MDYPGDPSEGSAEHCWCGDTGNSLQKSHNSFGTGVAQAGQCHFSPLSPNSHPGSGAVPGKKKMESGFGVRGGVIADVWIVAGFCLKGGGGGKGRGNISQALEEAEGGSGRESACGMSPVRVGLVPSL